MNLVIIIFLLIAEMHSIACWWAQLCTNTHSINLRRLSPHFNQSLNLHQIVLWHHKLLPHFTAFPFLLPGLDLSWIERPLVQMVFLLLLLKGKKTEKDSWWVKYKCCHLMSTCFNSVSFMLLVECAWTCFSLCACVSPSWCPWCPAASSPSTGQRSRRDQYKTSGPPFHRPYRELFTNIITTSGYQLHFVILCP